MPSSRVARMVSISTKPGSRPVRKRAFSRHSSNSAPASLSSTMPAPMPRLALRTSLAVRLAQRQGADRHRHAELATARRPGRRRDPADRAGVEPARRAFQPGDQLHRVVLGRPGDRAAGKGGAQQVGEAQGLGGRGAHGGGHLEQRGMRLDREQLGHLHRADARDAPEVVAQQVHDHQVLCAVLGVIAEPARHLAVALGCAAARGGALHRPGGELAALLLQEQLGRARQTRSAPHRPAAAR